MTTNPEVYFTDGCGRCTKFATPDCKVNTWRPILLELRRVMNSTGLTEEMKWGNPCYTRNGENIAMIVTMKGWCGVSFFKGALLDDPAGHLHFAGPNSRHDKSHRFISLAQLEAQEPQLLDFVHQTIELHKVGAQVPKKKETEEVPEEFQEILGLRPDVEAAWNNLTPGRRRGYLIHFSGAKQSATRVRRIEKWIPEILKGNGMHA